MWEFSLDRRVLQRPRTRVNQPARTQNPVVRKHRVGPSPTSGIKQFLQISITLIPYEAPLVIAPGAFDTTLARSQASVLSAGWCTPRCPSRRLGRYRSPPGSAPPACGTSVRPPDDSPLPAHDR